MEKMLNKDLLTIVNSRLQSCKSAQDKLRGIQKPFLYDTFAGRILELEYIKQCLKNKVKL